MSKEEILALELSADPLTRGYAGMSDDEVADSLNTENRQVIKDLMTGDEIAAAASPAEYLALPEGQKDRFIAVCSNANINPQGFIVTVIVDIFGQGSDTITALAAARLQSVTRAKELGIPKVKVGWVMEARA